MKCKRSKPQRFDTYKYDFKITTIFKNPKAPISTNLTQNKQWYKNRKALRSTN